MPLYYGICVKNAPKLLKVSKLPLNFNKSFKNALTVKVGWKPLKFGFKNTLKLVLCFKNAPKLARCFKNNLKKYKIIMKMLTFCFNNTINI